MRSFSQRVPEGDNRVRAVCDACGFVAYINPKVVVGSVIAADGKVLLCRRAIEPRRGYWTLPAGYMEEGETLEEGARREALEEAEARVSLDGILAVFSVSRISQVQVIFRGSFEGAARFAPGEESLDVRLFDWASIPWDELAFPTVRWALDAWRAVGEGALGAPAVNPPADRRGVARLPVEAGL